MMMRKQLFFAALLLLPSYLVAQSTEMFRMEPYLQNYEEDAITVSWVTNPLTYSWVEYGTDTTQLQLARTLLDGQALCNNRFHHIRLTELERGERYYYRVCSQEMLSYRAYSKEFGEIIRSPYYTFELPKASEEDFTAVIFNDLHKRDTTIRALHAALEGIEYDFAIFNGDCIDDPQNEEQAIESISVINEVVGASSHPVYYIRGNHEIRGAYSIGLRDLLAYMGESCYGAFNWGDSRIVVLDCGEDKPDTTAVYYGLNDFSGLRSEQAEFLEEELNSEEFEEAQRRILVHHIPLYCERIAYNPSHEAWHPLLKTAPFDVAINGHTHRFEVVERGELGNNFPVVIGGGHLLDSATVMVLRKRGSDLTLEVLSATGEQLIELEL